jgi:hypothetical protein
MANMTNTYKIVISPLWEYVKRSYSQYSALETAKERISTFLSPDVLAEPPMEPTQNFDRRVDKAM